LQKSPLRWHFLFVTQIIFVYADISEETELAAAVALHVENDTTGVLHKTETSQSSARHFSHVDVPDKAPAAKPNDVLVS
jgi:hypothetical protein